MRKTREMPAEIVLPGHGEPITDHVALIDDRFAKHERRKEKIFELIAERPRSGYEIAQAIWGNVAVTQAFLTLSEVIGHVDLLVNEGRGAVEVGATETVSPRAYEARRPERYQGAGGGRRRSGC